MQIELNAEQLAAVSSDSNKVLVAAGAGSGKTTTIMARIEFLLEQGIDPKKVYAITFTNAAAAEMRSRLPAEAGEVFIGTIHSLANRILLSNGIQTASKIEDNDFDWLLEQIYERDLFMPEVEHLLVDEFQDICENEYNFMIKDLQPKNFYAVGDSQQAIYSFKGANYKFFMELLRNPEVEVFNLTYNYRSGSSIIDFAESILASVDDVYKVGMKCKSGRRGYVETATFTVDKILEELEYDNRYSKWFILCRTNQEVDNIITLLEKNGIPCETFKKADLDLSELNSRMENNTVKVLTIHTSKGLENDNVMVIGAHRWNNEEKRVSFVAATRARGNLFWLVEPKKNKGTKRKLTYMEF